MKSYFFIMILFFSFSCLARGDLKIHFDKAPWRYSYIEKSLKRAQHFIVHKSDRDLTGFMSFTPGRYSKSNPKGKVLETNCNQLSKGKEISCKFKGAYSEIVITSGKKNIYQYAFVTKRSKKGFYLNRLVFNKKPKEKEIAELIQELLRKMP